MSRHLGYIVQSQNDEDYTPYHGNVRLYTSFQEAFTKAKEFIGLYLKVHHENYDGPFDVHTPSKKQCDDAGSVVVFRSPSCIIWIDRVVE